MDHFHLVENSTLCGTGFSLSGQAASLTHSVHMLRAALILLVSTSASAAQLRDVSDPAKVKDDFPAAAKLRIVNSWATWCVPCVGEMPELRAVALALRPDVALVGVSMDDMI